MKQNQPWADNCIWTFIIPLLMLLNTYEIFRSKMFHKRPNLKKEKYIYLKYEDWWEFHPHEGINAIIEGVSYLRNGLLIKRMSLAWEKKYDNQNKFCILIFKA